MIFGLEFPPISHTVEWPDLFGSGPFAVNKVVLLMWLSAALVFALFFAASRTQTLVPAGAKNLAEAVVDFIRESVILQTMGPDGLRWTPFLLTVFSFIFVCNIWGIIPLVQMPVNARIALPAFLALMVWVIYNFMGIKSQGFFGYLKSVVMPPGVPKAILPLVALIEFVSKIFVYPFALAVRLFANMLAGHLLLISFAVIASALFESTYVGAAVPLGVLIGLTGFELLVAVLQAYNFTILTAVFISGAIHPEH
ncbi:MAG: F0F1 ATP synthase subunit A [Acidimicrobiales bacterium]